MQQYDGMVQQLARLCWLGGGWAASMLCLTHDPLSIIVPVLVLAPDLPVLERRLLPITFYIASHTYIGVLRVHYHIHST